MQNSDKRQRDIQRKIKQVRNAAKYAPQDPNTRAEFERLRKELNRWTWIDPTAS